MKIFISSFHRASDGALEHLIKRMKEEDIYTDDYKEADYIVAVGDRIETYDFVLERYREGYPIIHLWAGEISEWETENDVYRHSMTLMSDMQLCQHELAVDRVKDLCKMVNKKPNVHLIGNLMLDNLETDETIVPNEPYDLVLYNPPSRLSDDEIAKEVSEIIHMDRVYTLWVESNGDKGSTIIKMIVTNYIINQEEPKIEWHFSLPRPQFLGLLKNCRKFITNSTTMHHEAPFLIDKEKIIHIGARNRNRECEKADMSIGNATEKMIDILKGLDD